MIERDRTGAVKSPVPHTTLDESLSEPTSLIAVTVKQVSTPWINSVS